MLWTGFASVMGIARLIAHPVSEPSECCINFLARLGISNRVFESAAHADELRVALGFSDRKSDVALAQPWMAFVGPNSFLGLPTIR